MPIYRDIAAKLLADLGSEVRAGYELRAEFLKRLAGDDDWSFVIKAQALVEAALTDAVISSVGDVRLKRLVARLPIADEENGKLALALELGLIDRNQRRFIRTMASLRNRLAHRVEDVAFKFSDYSAALTHTQRKAWQDSIIWFATDGEQHSIWCDILNSQPRSAVYVAMLSFLSLLQVSAVEATTKRRLDAAALETAEKLFGHLAKSDA